MVRENHQLNGREFEQTPGDNGLQSRGSWKVRHDGVTEQQ